MYCFSLPTGQRQLVCVSLHVSFEWSVGGGGVLLLFAHRSETTIASLCPQVRERQLVYVSLIVGFKWSQVRDILFLFHLMCFKWAVGG